MKKVWPDSFVEEGNLSINISTIRKALGERPNWHQYIATVPRRGYRFVAEVKESFVEDFELTVEENTRSHILIEREESGGFELEETRAAIQDRDMTGDIGGAQATVLAGKEVTVQRAEVLGAEKTLDTRHSVSQTGIHKRVLIAALVILIIVAGGIYYFFFFHSNTGDSIAVLPFIFISTDTKNLAEPDREYLSDGITESVINSLSQFTNLRVIARRSVFHYQGKDIDPQQVGRDLGVRTVLIGRIIQRGENLTIKTELSDVRDNRQIWGNNTTEKYRIF